MLKRVVIAVALLAAIAVFQLRKHEAILSGPGEAEAAFRDGRSGVMVTAEGTIERTLSDDTQGEPHQRCPRETVLRRLLHAH